MNNTMAVPKVAILERLLAVMEENYWMYGTATLEAPNRVERWDLRSMIDYAVLTTGLSQMGFPTFPTFYLQRNTVCQLLMEMEEFQNWGEWRMWETEEARTGADIERVVKRALEAERTRAAQ